MPGCRQQSRIPAPNGFADYANHRAYAWEETATARRYAGEAGHDLTSLGASQPPGAVLWGWQQFIMSGSVADVADEATADGLSGLADVRVGSKH